MPDFPNLFMLLGPNTGLGHNSMVYMIESQIAYVLDALRAMREHDAATVEVRPEAAEAFNQEVDRAARGHGVEQRLLELVPRRHRPQRHAVARLDVPLPAPDLVVQPGALPAGVMKRVLLTGAASGIGEATAAELRRQGVQVAGLDLHEGEGIIACDVTDQESVDRAVAEAHRAASAAWTWWSTAPASASRRARACVPTRAPTR